MIVARLCLLALLAWATGGVPAAAAGVPVDGNEFFEQRIRPVLVEQCYKCHSAQAEKLKGGLRLDSRAGLLKGGESAKPAVVPGDAAASRLVEAIRYHNPDLQMPPKARLSDAQVADFVAWVNMGAPDPRTDTPAVVTKPDPHAHWAFQRPKPQSVPAVRDAQWPRTDVDRFVLAKLEEKGIAPSPQADRRTLIRRATFDLTGLPPTPAEVEAFVQDSAPDAYEKVIDRLLASPRYGERWGRYWLDLARYSDTKGYVYSDREERYFVHAHAYRDWVIRALNEDMPYDRFLMLQVAADQVLSKEEQAKDNRDLAAMGFLTLGRRFLGIQADIIDDRIDTLSRTALGLTVGCARCHDHKFDPIPTADYYSLYGVFANSTERYVRLGPEPAHTDAYNAYAAELKKRTDKLESTFATRRAEADDRARTRTGDYLVAVLDVEKLRNEIFYMNLGPEDLSPLVARQWQAYLFRASKKPFDPIFTPWNTLAALAQDQFAAKAPEVITRLMGDAANPVNPLVAQALAASPPASMKDVALAYGKLFVNAEKAWKAAKKADANVTCLSDPNQEALRQVLYADDSPARVPPGPVVEVEVFFPEGVRVELAKLQQQIDHLNVESAGAPPYALILEDRTGAMTNPRVFKRGNPATRGEEVPRQFLEVIAGPHRKPFQHGSGRLELARAIASPENPLTARVMVNRLWMHHFGRGLVDTPSDLGVRCETPTHLELLDWLALKFVESGPSTSSGQGWSLKQMHRLLMLSSVYQQASNYDNPAARAIDPENKLLWRMNRGRLDFESMRDSLLFASGELDLTTGGRPVEMFKQPFTARRSIYGLVDRQFLPGTFRVFDFANPDLHMPQRPDTTVPQQALYFMNSPFVAGRARALLKRPDFADATDPTERIRRLYQAIYQRDPTPHQIEVGRQFVAQAQEGPKAEAPKPIVSAWQYGYGEYDPASQQLKSFEKLPHFTGEAWQGGPSWPDEKLGWARLTADGGHAGNDLKHAVVRRWTAPRDMTVSVAGTIQHAPKEGDGIRATVLSSRHGHLATWTLHAQKAEAKIEPVQVEAGDTIDFVVDIRGNLNNDEFTWAPVIKDLAKQPAKAGTDDTATEWNAKKEFAGPSVQFAPLDAWEQYAQVLLLSNEFLFVD